MALSLENLQRLLYRLIAAPSAVPSRRGNASSPLGAKGWNGTSSIEQAGGAAAAGQNLPEDELGAVIRGDERLSAAARVKIYADAYFYRLRDAMKEDYPAVLAVLGADDFDGLIGDYLAAYPPDRPSVFYAGEFLADFLRGHPAAARFPFIADLALLERTLIEVFHGPDAPALTQERLRAVPPSEWPAIAMRAHPTLRVVRSAWKVADVKRALDEQLKWREPDHEPSRILLWRQDDFAYYRELERAEYGAFELLAAGSNFAAICEAIAADGAQRDDPSPAINRLLHRWLADGVLAAGAPPL